MSGRGFGFAMVLLIVGAGLTARAAAQETKSARGTVTAVGGDSITVRVAERELRFSVDPKTALTASGAGTADAESRRGRQARTAGRRFRQDRRRRGGHLSGDRHHHARVNYPASHLPPAADPCPVTARKRRTARSIRSRERPSSFGLGRQRRIVQQSFAVDATTKSSPWAPAPPRPRRAVSSPSPISSESEIR